MRILAINPNTTRSMTDAIAATARRYASAGTEMAGLAETISATPGVPVVDGVAAGVRVAEAVVGMGLGTSKVCTYATPEPKTIVGWPLRRSL